MLMGIVIIVSSVLSALIFIKGQSSLFCGTGTEGMTVEKANTPGQTLVVPQKNEEIAEEVEC